MSGKLSSVTVFVFLVIVGVIVSGNFSGRKPSFFSEETENNRSGDSSENINATGEDYISAEKEDYTVSSFEPNVSWLLNLKTKLETVDENLSPEARLDFFRTTLDEAVLHLSPLEMEEFVLHSLQHVASSVLIDYGPNLVGKILQGDSTNYIPWLHALGDSMLERKFLSDAFTHLAALEQDDSIDLLLETLDDERKKSVVSNLAVMGASKNARKAIESLRTVYGDYIPENILVTAIGQFSPSADYEKVADILLKNENSLPSNQTSRSLMLMWARNSPEEAWKWSEEYLFEASKETKNAVVGGLVDGWCSSDFRKCGEQIISMESGDERDMASAHYARFAMQRDPASAIDWVNFIDDSEKKESVRRELFSSP